MSYFYQTAQRSVLALGLAFGANAMMDVGDAEACFVKVYKKAGENFTGFASDARFYATRSRKSTLSNPNKEDFNTILGRCKTIAQNFRQEVNGGEGYYVLKKCRVNDPAISPERKKILIAQTRQICDRNYDL